MSRALNRLIMRCNVQKVTARFHDEKKKGHVLYDRAIEYCRGKLVLLTEMHTILYGHKGFSGKTT